MSGSTRPHATVDPPGEASNRRELCPLVNSESLPVHPLLPVLLAAAGSTFPPVDGRVGFLPPLPGGLEAVVSFTGHAYVATSLPQKALADLALDGYGSALHPAVLLRIAGPHGEVGDTDAILVRPGIGGGHLPRRADLDDHPRVRHARALRTHVRVHGDQRGLITLSRGLAGRTELSVEVDEPGRGTGEGLVEDGLRLASSGEPVFAAVSPGNARSLRAFLTAGFRPIGSEVIIVSDRQTTAAPTAGP